HMLGTNNATCAKTLDSLASLRLSCKEYALAESIYRKALSIREANFGSTSPELGYELWQLGDICVNLGSRYLEATQLCKRALPLLNQAYGSNSTASVRCTLTLADALYGLKKFGDAEALAQQSLNYWTRKRGTYYSLTKA